MLVFDLHTVSLVFAVALLGGLVGLDRTAAGQVMVSQPLVAGPLTGWFLGDAATGGIIGAVLELIWLLDIPVGTFVPADATIGTVAAVTITILGSRGPVPLDLIGFSIVLSTAMVPITMMTEEFVRKKNARLAETAVSGPAEEAACRLSRSHLAGLMPFFLKSFLLYLFFIPAGLAAVVIFEQVPQSVHRGMELFVKLLPLLGAALILHKLSLAVFDRFFLAGFAAAAVLAVLLPRNPTVVILFVAVAGFAGAKWWSERRG